MNPDVLGPGSVGGGGGGAASTSITNPNTSVRRIPAHDRDYHGAESHLAPVTTRTRPCPLPPPARRVAFEAPSEKPLGPFDGGCWGGVVSWGGTAQGLRIGT